MGTNNTENKINKVSIESRTILLNEDISSETVEQAILAIREINNHDDQQQKKLKDYTRKPISVIIDSYGGEVYAALGMMNVMTSSKTPIHTYCYSKGFSAGFWIFICGHKRYIHEHATLLYHQVSYGTWGTVQDNKEKLKNETKLNNRLMDIVAKRTNIPTKKMKELNKRKIDWFISGKKAVKLNAADELIKDTNI